MITTQLSRQTLLAGSLARSLAVTVCLAGATPSPGRAAEPHQVAEVELVQGEVQLERAGNGVEPVVPGLRLLRHDRLLTQRDSRVAVSFKDGSRLVLGELAIVTIVDWRPEHGRTAGALLLDLEQGAIRLIASKPHKAPDKRVELRTPEAIIVAQGMDLWRGPIDGGKGILLLAGTVEIRNDAGFVMLDKSNIGTLVKDRHTSPERPRSFGADQLSKAMMTVGFGLR